MRPSAVVFSDRHAETFTAELTKPIVSEAPYPVLPTSEFHQDQVYIRGISEEDLEDIWVSDFVVVPPEDRDPPPSSDFVYASATNVIFEELRHNHAFGFNLPRWPRDRTPRCQHHGTT
ncbi:MAG TPA: hypothetical protein VL984_04065 [Acidimicrobiales bacterium]|nr:hypothetical protein [Acidimicrobiales bacterium]